MKEVKYVLLSKMLDIKIKLYRLMDSFLVEGDKPRSAARLNADRHLFVENALEELKSDTRTITEEDIAKTLTEWKIKSVDEKEEEKYSCSGCRYAPEPPDDCYVEREYDGTPCKICVQEAQTILSLISGEKE